jgi:HEAT repeat protein
MHRSPPVLALLLISALGLGAASPPASDDARVNGPELATYREALSSESMRTRLEGLTELLEARPDGAPALLGEFLGDPDRRFRRSVLDALVTLGDDEALAQLDRALADSHPETRADTLRAIAAWEGPAATLRLRESLSDPESMVVVAGVQGLIERDPSAHVDRLLPLLERPDDFVVRATALALMEAKSRDAIPALEKAANRASAFASPTAVEAIAGIGGPEAPAALIRLGGPGRSASIRQTAVSGLGQTPSPEAAAHLLTLLEPPGPGAPEDPDRDAMRYPALGALRAQGEYLRPHAARVAALLGSPDPVVREGILRVIRTTRLAGASEAVRQMAADGQRDPKERIHALRALIPLDPDACLAIAAELTENEDPTVRLQAVELLGGQTERSEVRTLLLGMLADGDPSVVGLSLDALRGQVGPAEVPSLAAARATEDVGNRTVVAALLGQTGSGDALPPLLELLDDPEPGVRRAAASALGRLGRPEAREALTGRQLDPDPGVRGAVRQALADLQQGS